jgi:hypothetical protein
LTLPKKKKQMKVTTKASKPAGTDRPPHNNSTMGRRWSKFGPPKEIDRHAELDASQATAVNAGERPTLVKKRRELADKKSVISDQSVRRVLDDLVEHSNMGNAPIKELLIGRKSYWKREFSELTKEDFTAVWKDARQRFFQYNAENSASSGTTSRSKNLGSPAESVSRPLNGSIDTEFANSQEGVPMGNISDDDWESNNGNKDEETQPIGESEDGSAAHHTTGLLDNSRPPDRWSKLFLSPLFQLNNQFTLDKFEEYL